MKQFCINRVEQSPRYIVKWEKDAKQHRTQILWGKLTYFLYVFINSYMMYTRN